MRHRLRTRAIGVAAVGLAALVAAAGCSSSSPTVETGSKSASTTPAGADAPRGTGTSVPGTVDTTPGTTALAGDAGTTVPGETTTTAAGAAGTGGPAATTANGAPVTTTGGGAAPGAVTTAPVTTAKPGTPPTAPVTTTPVTTVATTTPTTIAPTTLSAYPAPDPTHPANSNQIMCMGTAPASMVTVQWNTNGTQVAIAIGNFADAFASPSPMTSPASATQKSFNLSCTAQGTQYTTVTAQGPGGKSQSVVIEWTIMKM